MACYHPLKAYRSREKNPATGGYLITFNATKALVEGSSLTLPCGRCIGCRMAKAEEWAVRCTHEAQMHKHNCFITLTFNQDKLPEDYSVHVRTWQLFMKRLREHYKTNSIRFFAVGEYGDQTLRPHYHALLFNHHFPDKIPLSISSSKTKNTLYSSPTLSKLWTFGHSSIGNVTFNSAAYCARYAMKKIGGDKATDHYTRLHPIHRTYHQVQPEFCVQSRRPGLGAAWYERFKDDCFPSDFLIVEGKHRPIPRFYDLKLKEDALCKIKRLRKANGLKSKADHTPERLQTRETIKLARTRQLVRSLKDH